MNTTNITNYNLSCNTYLLFYRYVLYNKIIRKQSDSERSIFMVLDNMKFTGKESLTFVPIELINTFCHFLDVEYPDVDFKCIKCKDIQRNPELRKKYRPYQEQCRTLLFKLDMNLTSKQTDMTVLSQTSTRNGYSIVFVHSLNRMSILSPMNTWNVHLAIMTLITMIESYRQSGAVVSTSSVAVNSVINLKT